MKLAPRSLRKYNIGKQMQSATAIRHEIADDDSSSSSDRPTNDKKKAIQKRRTRKERKLREAQVFNGGKWSRKERLEFLRGLRKFGPGKWKKIQTILKTRSNIQIKSHGQKILQRMEAGEDIYFDLKSAEATGDVPSSPKPTATIKDEDDSHSTASTSPSTDPSSSDGEEGDETASMVSEISWTETYAHGQERAVDWQSYNPTTAAAATTTTAWETNVEASANTFLVDNNQIFVQGQSSARPVSSLSLDEATVVLALFDLANPVKLQDRVAAASRFAMV